jgi:hypothetical protein
MLVEAAAMTNGEPKAKIFISYSRKDLAFVELVDAALRTCGFEPLIDREEIYAFEDWWKRLQTLINQPTRSCLSSRPMRSPPARR